jgi:hypothetical protein
LNASLFFVLRILALPYSDHPDFQPSWGDDWPRGQ